MSGTTTHSKSRNTKRSPGDLALEEKTPVARWIILAVFLIFGCGFLTFWINSGNPPINAAALSALTPDLAPTPTLIANANGYSARLEIYPPDPVPAGSDVVFTSTLLLNGQPVPDARVQIHLNGTRGAIRSVKGQPTGQDGVSVTTYNIARIFKEFLVKVDVAFYKDDVIVIRATNEFTPRN